MDVLLLGAAVLAAGVLVVVFAPVLAGRMNRRRSSLPFARSQPPISSVWIRIVGSLASLMGLFVLTVAIVAAVRG